MKLANEIRIAYKIPEIRYLVLKGIGCWFLFWLLMPITIGMRLPFYFIVLAAEYIQKTCELLLDIIPSPSGDIYGKRQEYIYAAHTIMKPEEIQKRLEN